MADQICGYDCSVTAGGIPPNPDISGIGVVISYTATAGFAVAILVVYYIAAYRPEIDPFQNNKAGSELALSVHFRPNAVDQMFLGLVPTCFRQQKQLEAVDCGPTRMEEIFTKCILTMSDIQTVSGLSILISGFSQLQCGLASYHWQVIVNLAWFSSLTHLACLTFLRKHLYENPSERVWRLSAMGILAVMLVVALIPTGNHTWMTGELSMEASDPTICHSKPERVNSDAFGDMLLSVFLVTLGFLARVVRLHHFLSVNTIAGVRSRLSHFCRSRLQVLYDKTHDEDRTCSFGWTLLYRHALASFLCVRIFMDIWQSIYNEIFWVGISFAWGSYKLALTRSIDGARNDESDSWSFGQVVPVVLLAAPLITFMTHFSGSKSSQDAPEPEAYFMEPRNATDTQSMDLNKYESFHDPDQDFYKATWFRVLTLAVLSSLTAVGIAIFFIPYPENSTSLFSKFKQNNYFICIDFVLTVIQLIMLGFVRHTRILWHTFENVVSSNDKWLLLRKYMRPLSSPIMFLLIFGSFAQTMFSNPWIWVSLHSGFFVLFCGITWVDCTQTLPVKTQGQIESNDIR